MEASSSFSSSHYSSLLETVSALRGDLDKAVSKIQLLEEQNRVLHTNYDTVKDELFETRRKYNEAQQNYMTTIAAKLENEKQNEEFLAKIRFELEAKTDEFEQLRDKFTPQDVDYIRIKVQEELEIPHKVKLQAMEEEMEKAKDMYYTLRRELERTKAEFDAYSALQERELIVCKEERDLLVEGLKKQLAELQESSYSPEKDDQIRSMKLKVREVEFINETLRTELFEARKAKDDAVIEKSQRISASEFEQKELRRQMTSLLADAAAADSRATAAANECERKNSTIKELRGTLTELGSSIASLRKEVDDKNEELLLAKSKYADEIRAAISTVESAKGETETKCIELQILLHERDEAMRRLQWESQDMRTLFESNERKMRSELSQKLKEFKSKTDSLEIELAESNLRTKSVEMKVLQSQDQFHKDLGILKSDNFRLQKEKDLVNEKLRTVEIRLEETSKTFGKSEKEWLNKLHSSEDVINSQRERLSELQIALERTTKQMNETTETMHAANLRAETHSTQLDNLKREAKGKHDELSKTYKEKLSQLKQTFKQTIEKEKRRSEGYKDKALIAHEKLKEILGSSGAARISSEDFVETAEIF